MSLYRRGQVTVEARHFQHDPGDIRSQIRYMDSLMAWINEGQRAAGRKDASWDTSGVIGLIIPAPDGEHIARIGDWIVRDEAGKFFPCSLGVFNATYR